MRVLQMASLDAFHIINIAGHYYNACITTSSDAPRRRRRRRPGACVIMIAVDSKGYPDV
jgi:hypothetical protein